MNSTASPEHSSSLSAPSGPGATQTRSSAQLGRRLVMLLAALVIPLVGTIAITPAPASASCTKYTQRKADFYKSIKFQNTAQLYVRWLAVSGTYQEQAHDACYGVRPLYWGSTATTSAGEQVVMRYRLRWSNGSYTRGVCGNGADGLNVTNGGRWCGYPGNSSPGGASLYVTKVKMMMYYSKPANGSYYYAQAHQVCTTHPTGSGSSSCAGGMGLGPSAF
jgi:hypothetical protein